MVNVVIEIGDGTGRRLATVEPRKSDRVDCMPLRPQLCGDVVVDPFTLPASWDKNDRRH
jgi:hypothetical protein